MPTGTSTRILSFVVLGLFFTFLGFIIASNLDFTPKSSAQMSSDPYPVTIDANGKHCSPFVGVVEKVTDAVVHISAEHDVQNKYRNDIYFRFFGIPQEPSQSFGSGFFFREDGYILTNNHVVSGAQRVYVRTSSGYQYDATIIGADPQTDLAVIKVEPNEDIEFIPFGNSNDIRVGDWAIAIGNPFPQQGLDRSVTVGVISAKGRSNLRFGEGTPRFQDYIQTDASINPGNSGGPLVGLDGKAIGVNAAISSPTGASVGISFAIPINLARSIVPDLIATGRVSRAWLGVYLSELTEAQARTQGLSAVKGVGIESVFDGSPAADAGIVDGDILVYFNGQDVIDIDHFSVLVATAPKNQQIEIGLMRQGKYITVNAVPVDRNQYQLAHSEQFARPTDQLTWLGMELLNFNENIARQIGSEFFPGVYINRITRGSPAYKAGFLPGSIITQIDKNEI
ncbi:MAG: PDZ domain-containing protein, partial [candidate division Zixibacteria bacterium]|nr:PDZ domain-containing protein [candidate division Zixibacteria bacterium]